MKPMIFMIFASDLLLKEKLLSLSGGFMPREPILQNGYGTTYPEKDGSLQGNPEDPSALFPPSITLPPKLKTGKLSSVFSKKISNFIINLSIFLEHCFSEGREYSHGDVLPEAAACIQCVCFYGEVICQEAACPKVKYGCRRLAEKEANSCCGKVVCGKKRNSGYENDHLLTLIHFFQI